MSTFTESHEIFFSCDMCDEEYETHEEDFLDALDKIKNAGWKVFKQDDEWIHLCGQTCWVENQRKLLLKR